MTIAASDLKDPLEVATRLARQASRVVLGHFQSRLEVQHKAGDEPVTRADRESEAVILAGLRRAFPGHGILSEESAREATWRLDGYTWIVDPLDGTKDFIAGLQGFSVMLGLLEKDRPVLGVVHQPTTGITYRAARGHGAELLRDGERPTPLQPSTETEPSRLRLVVSNSHRSEKTEQVKRALGIEDELRLGSVGLKVGLVARAERDLYVHPSSRCKLWDVCAPEAIITIAGGKMTDLHGAPLRYGPGEIFVQGGIVASNRVCHDEVIRRIAPLFP